MKWSLQSGETTKCLNFFFFFVVIFIFPHMLYIWDTVGMTDTESQVLDFLLIIASLCIDTKTASPYFRFIHYQIV